MTIKEAIDTLGNVVNTQTTDGNVKRKLSDTNTANTAIHKPFG